MENTEWWTRFEKTGNITDYLSYRGVIPCTENKETGERTFESVNSSYRNDIVCNTNRGI